MSAKKTEFAEHLKAAKMPNLRIETNVAKEKIKDLPGFLKELSSALAATTGKPEQYMVVQVIPDMAMLFGGTDAPCANAFFMCIGKLGEDENKAHAAKIFPIVTAHLGVPEDRMYILFHDAKTSEVAWKATTFQAILGK